MNWAAISAIYVTEMQRFFRTLAQSFHLSGDFDVALFRGLWRRHWQPYPRS